MNCNDSMINNFILKKRNDPGRNFQVLAISNRHLCNQPFEDQIKRVCEWHPDALVLREKDLPEDEYKALAKNILDICKAYDVPCILHTYWKTALELGHDAIHLPLPLLRELSAESQKHLQSQNSTISQNFHVTDFHKIGTSVHSVEDAMEAERLGATYVTAGHIFTTDCKKGLPPRGLDFLKNVCDAVTIPVYGIGGIKFDPQQWNSLKKTRCLRRVYYVRNDAALKLHLF